jgi:hypothetical protein
VPIACSLLGHRVFFESEGERMRWHCQRGCGFEGEKSYSTAAEASAYATAFNRPEAEIGHRSLLSLAPLRLAKGKRLR